MPYPVWWYGYAMVKMTFTLDDETADLLRKTTARLAKPQSAIVREAIREYGARAGRLSEDERRRMLRSIDAFLTHRPSRTAAAVERELRDVRKARRLGGRRSG
jgi:predicted transcriptional regulator